MQKQNSIKKQKRKISNEADPARNYFAEGRTTTALRRFVSNGVNKKIKISEKILQLAIKKLAVFILVFLFGFSNTLPYLFTELGFPEIGDSLKIKEAQAVTAYQAAGAIAYSASGGTSVAPAYPASIVAGDLLVLIIGMKPSTANSGSVTTPSGWTPIVSLTGAGGYGTTLGADTGNTNVFTFYKVAAGGESGSLTVTIAANNVSWAQMYRFSAGAGSTWNVAGTTGSDVTGGAAVSITMSSNPGVTAGDYILGAMVIPTNVTTPAQFSAEALSQPGITFGTVTEISEPDSSTGNDIGGVTYCAPVSSGTASAAPTFTATAGGTTTNVRGPGVFIRVREIVPPPTLDQTYYRFRNDDGNEGVPAGWYSPWGYRKQITINYTKVGSNLTDFPVLISLNGDRDLSNYAQADADDILFTSSDGTTKLSHEIEKYVSSTGELVAWVKTNLSSTVNTTLYMYYGEPGAANQASAIDAWDAGYKMVQHLEESSGSGAYLLDSTTNANNGTPTTPAFAGDAEIDGGRAFNGSTDYISVANNAGLQITQNLTVSAWVYIYSWNDWARVVSKKSTLNNGYEILLGDAGRYIRFEIGITAGTLVADSAANSINTGSWQYVTAVFDRTGTTGYVYINGSQSGAPPSWTQDMATNVYDVNIGRRTSAATNYFWGTIDEVRISNVARTAAWISTEYNNQKQPSSFFGIGEAVSSGKATWKAGEDISTTVGKNDNIRLRFSIKNTGSVATGYNYRLQYSTLSAATCELEPTGNFADVPTTAGSAVIMASSSYIADAASATRQLSIPASLAFASGKVVALPSNQTAAFSLDQNNFTEFEYAFKFTATSSYGATYCLRTTNAGTALNSYTKVATVQLATPIVDETHYRVRNDNGSEGGSLTIKKHTGYTMVKPVMIGSSRYIVRGKGSSWNNPLGPVEIWTADSSWNLVTLLETSAGNTGDFYALSYPDQLGSNIILVFGTKNVSNLAFISAYNITTDTWTWVDTNQDGAIYITDVVWSPGDSMFYIVPASFNQNLNFVWKSTAANLLIPANWVQVTLSAYSYSELELRAEYFKGDLYFLRSDKQYNGDLIKMTLAGVFSTISTFSSATTESFKIYPYLNGDADYLMVTIPIPTPSPHFDVKYSTDGSTFIKLTEAPILSTMGTHSERQAYAYPPDANGRFLVFNSTNGDFDNNYLASYYSDGTLHDKLTGYMGHYTERRKIIDGNYIVQGGELGLDMAPYADIKLYLNNGANWKAAEDTTTTSDKDVNIRARFSVKNTGGLAEAYNYRLQYSTLSAATCELEPTGNFADVPTSAGSAVIMASSSYIADAASTTRQLTIPASLTFTSGKVVTLPSNQTASFSLGQNKFTEFEYAFKFTSNASPSADYCFRLKNGATSALNSYTKVAKITTISWADVIILDQNHYRFRDDSATLDTDSGWLAEQDAIYGPLVKNALTRLRVGIANTGSLIANSYTYRLESAIRVGAACGDDETFADVPVTATTEHWEIVDSLQYVNDDNIIVSRLTPTGTFANGKAVEDPFNQTTAYSLANDNYTEFEYAIQATSNAVNSGTYCFRITNAGSTTNFTYSLYPQITFSFRPAIGNLTSVVYDTGVIKPAYNSIMWKGLLPGGTRVRLKLAASDNSAGPWTFTGSDGVNCGTVFWYEPTTPSLPVKIGCYTNFNNKRYFKYQVQLCSSNDCVTSGIDTPTVNSIIVNWSP